MSLIGSTMFSLFKTSETQSLVQADSSPVVSCPNISALITPRISLLKLTTFFEFINLHASLLNVFREEKEREWVEPGQAEGRERWEVLGFEREILVSEGEKWREATVDEKVSIGILFIFDSKAGNGRVSGCFSV
nr:hypothetical protein Iba_chr13cCG13280 [Ipomoea batatas]